MVVVAATATKSCSSSRLLPGSAFPRRRFSRDASDDPIKPAPQFGPAERRARWSGRATYEPVVLEQWFVSHKGSKTSDSRFPRLSVSRSRGRSGSASFSRSLSFVSHAPLNPSPAWVHSSDGREYSTETATPILCGCGRGRPVFKMPAMGCQCVSTCALPKFQTARALLRFGAPAGEGRVGVKVPRTPFRSF